MKIMFQALLFTVIGICFTSISSSNNYLFDKVKVYSAIISKDGIRSITSDTNIERFYVSMNYRNRDLHKDEIILNIYYSKKMKKKMDILDTEVFENFSKIYKTQNLSSCSISRDKLYEIYDKYKNDQEVQYFIFAPALYDENKKFIYFEIYLADQSKVIIKNKDRINKYLVVGSFDPSPPAIAN